MNIIEAIKSGKRFKRKNERDWTGNDPEASKAGLRERALLVDYSGIVADDYEIEEKSITITESEFDAATERVRDQQPHRACYPKQLKEELFK